jgi:hypothetical protein
MEHTCDGDGSRRRNYPTNVLMAVSTPEKKVISIASDPGGLQQAQKLIGLPVVKPAVAASLFREASAPSYERFLLELHYLESFFQDCRTKDPHGLYEVETETQVYCGRQCRVIKRWAVSFGAADGFVNTTDVLQFMAMDGGHMQHVFGGILLAGIVPTANRAIFPVIFGWFPSEEGDAVAWLTRLCGQRFPGKKFVIKSDQGSGNLSEVFFSLLFPSFFDFHWIFIRLRKPLAKTWTPSWLCVSSTCTRP